jgi:hypothetical protein
MPVIVGVSQGGAGVGLNSSSFRSPAQRAANPRAQNEKRNDTDQMARAAIAFRFARVSARQSIRLRHSNIPDYRRNNAMPD